LTSECPPDAGALISEVVEAFRLDEVDVRVFGSALDEGALLLRLGEGLLVANPLDIFGS
jgi:hypothetical protein